MPGHKVSIAAPVQSGNFSFLWSWQARPAMIIIHYRLKAGPASAGPSQRRLGGVGQA